MLLCVWLTVACHCLLAFAARLLNACIFRPLQVLSGGLRCASAAGASLLLLARQHPVAAVVVGLATVLTWLVLGLQPLVCLLGVAAMIGTMGWLTLRLGRWLTVCCRPLLPTSRSPSLPPQRNGTRRHPQPLAQLAPVS